jgi:putative ABC transport system ATP-binding protein
MQTSHTELHHGPAPERSADAVVIQRVSKTYGTGELAVHALKPTDLRVGRGEIFYLVGPSGSGKTTLLSILGCVLAPSGGEVRLFGETVSDRPESHLPDLRLRYVGFVFQGYNLIASLTARENVELPLLLRGVPPRQAHEQAEDMLARVGLGDVRNRKPRDISGGQKQRVAIARALAGAPPLILADEPTAALDAQNGRQVVELLLKLAHEDGRTAIIVTHDNRIYEYADRIAEMDDGHIIAQQDRRGGRA